MKLAAAVCNYNKHYSWFSVFIIRQKCSKYSTFYLLDINFGLLRIYCIVKPTENKAAGIITITKKRKFMLRYCTLVLTNSDPGSLTKSTLQPCSMVNVMNLH